MKIRSDNKGAALTVEKITELLSNNGAFLHPSLRCDIHDGNITLTTEGPCGENEEIIHVPDSLLVPVSSLRLCLAGKGFDIVGKRPHISALQDRILDLMLELYMQTEKAVGLEQRVLWVALRPYPAIAELLKKARGVKGKRETEVNRMLDPANARHDSPLLASEFLRMRVLGAKKESGDGEARVENILMPIIDFLNHHPDGSQFGMGDKNKPGVSIAARRPFADTSECFAFYHHMDALDSLVEYQFLETSVPIVKSIACEIHLPGLGTIQLDSKRNPAKVADLAPHVQDLFGFIPVCQQARPDTIDASHLIIPAGTSPNALRRVLRYLVVRLPKARNWPLPRLVPHIYEAERQVIEKNLEFYRNLENAAESAGKQNPAPILKSLLALARLQTLKLHKYRFDDGFFQRRMKAAA